VAMVWSCGGAGVSFFDEAQLMMQRLCSHAVGRTIAALYIEP
jgi:hypothetical protein